VTRLLGIDVGERRIGLAVADTASGAVRPLTTISRADATRDGETLGRVTREQRIDELVIGLPLNMDGTEGAQARLTRAWATSVAALLGLPIAWRDERLTSERAESAMERAPRGRAGGPPSTSARNARRQRIDREAAAGILQAELDARSSQPTTTKR
jgi:putative Holliday junction resolvase